MTPQQPPVTCVLVTHNRRPQVLETLAHLGSLPERPAVILVDNGSSDGTADAVAAAYPDVDVVRLPSNIGAAARNVGVARARTPYVAFCDDDSWWRPGALGLAAAHLDAAPRLGLLAARILVGESEQTDGVSAMMARSPLARRTDLPGPTIRGFVACGAVVRRRAFLAVGGFARLLFFFGEEDVLAQDLAAAGWGLAYVPEVLAVHHPGKASRDPHARRRQATRNALLSAWLRRRPGGAARVTARVVREARGDRAVTAGCYAALRRLPDVLARRRPVPRWLEDELRLLEAVAG